MLDWSPRHAPEAARDGRFSGPIGRRLVGELDTVLAALDAIGATDAGDGFDDEGVPLTRIRKAS